MRDEARKMTEQNMLNELYNLVHNYMVIYDEYYETMSRDSAFLKDLADSIIGISAVLEVYARDKEIHCDYVLEKLENSKRYIDACVKYFQGKKEVEEYEETKGALNEISINV